MVIIITCLIINLIFVLKRSSIIDTIGKFLTSVLLLLLIVVIVNRGFMPISKITNTQNVFFSSLIEGYQTMDAIAALLFAAIITTCLKYKGYKKKDMSSMILNSSLIAAIWLAFVYGGLMYMGAQTTTIASSDLGKTELLLFIAQHILCSAGPVVIGLAMWLAYLSTSIGLISADTDFFEKVSKGKLTYKFNAIFISLVFSLLLISGLNLSFFPLSKIGFGWVIPTIFAIIIEYIIFKDKTVKSSDGKLAY